MRKFSVSDDDGSSTTFEIMPGFTHYVCITQKLKHPGKSKPTEHMVFLNLAALRVLAACAGEQVK